MSVTGKTLLRTVCNQWMLHSAFKLWIFALSTVPFFWLLWSAVADRLGANPAEALIRSTGDWSLRFLCATLAVTPLRITLGLPALARLRRMLGLFTYFYASWHLLAYAWFDMGLDLGDIVRDIPKRPFILVGFAAFLLLTPLAATSFNRAVKAVGATRWRALHRAVYLIGMLVILHFFWMRAGKKNFQDVFFYGAAIATLLGWRVLRWWQGRSAAAPVPRARVETQSG